MRQHRRGQSRKVCVLCLSTDVLLPDQILQVPNSDWSHLVLVQAVTGAVQLLPLPALLPQLLLAPVLVDRPGLCQVPLELLSEDGGPVSVQGGVARVDLVGGQSATPGTGRVSESLRTTGGQRMVNLGLGLGEGKPDEKLR